MRKKNRRPNDIPRVENKYVLKPEAQSANTHSKKKLLTKISSGDLRKHQILKIINPSQPPSEVYNVGAHPVDCGHRVALE